MARRQTALQGEIIKLLAQGMKQQEIAAALDCNTDYVYRICADPGLKEAFYKECGAEIEALVPQAIRRLKGLIEDDSQQGSVHVAAVREVLDRSHLAEILDATQKEIRIEIIYE